MSIQEILKLPAADRIQMVSEIWDSLDAEDLQITPSQEQVLDHRMNQDQDGKITWHSLEKFKQQLKERKK